MRRFTVARSPPSVLLAGPAAVSLAAGVDVGVVRPNPRIILILANLFIGFSELPKFRIWSTRAGFEAEPVAAVATGVFSLLSSANRTFLDELPAL